jgi:olefin beta-lactone synthetase
MNIISRLEFAVKAHPTKPTFIFFSTQDKDWKTVTYQQLADSTQRFACGLLACGVIPGMTAALMTPPSADFFALAFALLRLGIVPIILDPAIGLKKVGECLAESKPDIFIGNTLTHTLRIILGWGKDTIKHNLTINSVKSQKSKVKDPILNYQTPITASAAIIYTSGSTGLPKGAVYTHANLAAQLDMLVETFNISQDEIDLPAFPLYAMIDALIGVTSIIPDITFPVPGKTNPEKMLGAIRKFNVTNMFASPVVLDILVKVQQQAVGLHKLQSLKRIITAGAPATIQLQENFRKLLNDETDLFGIYGATEVLPIAKIESREVFEVKEKSAKGAGICLGKPVNGAKVRIIKISESVIAQWQDSLEVLPNVVGEITVEGVAVTESYIAREDANLLSKIYNGDDVIHRMGDVGYFDEVGRLWYCGRKSHRVITKDDVLFTEQIEGIFNVHPIVYRTALVGVDKEPVLWVELAKNGDKEKIKLELMHLAKDRPQACKIKTFLFMKKFPTDVRHNSKIIREQLTLLAEKRLR